MKIMYPPGYQHNGFATTHAIGHMMYGSCAQVHELPCSHWRIGITGRAHCLSFWLHIYITLILLL